MLFVTSLHNRISYKTTKVYLAGIQYASVRRGDYTHWQIHNSSNILYGALGFCRVTVLRDMCVLQSPSVTSTNYMHTLIENL